MKKGLLIILGLISISTYAQQDAEYRQFLVNPYFFNCAYAGDHELSIMTSGVRLGSGSISQSQTSVLLMYDSPIQDQPAGIGFMINYDRGISEDLTSLKAGLAGNYKHEINEVSYLRIGAQINGYYFKDVSPATQDGDTTSLVADIDFGALFVQENFFLGLSSKNMARMKMNLSSEQPAELFRHMYISTGYKFDVSENFKVTPALLFRNIQNREQFDVHTQMEFFDKGIFGMTVQFSRIPIQFPYTLMLGYKLSDNFRFDAAAHLYRFGGTAAQFLNPIYELSIQFGM